MSQHQYVYYTPSSVAPQDTVVRPTAVQAPVANTSSAPRVATGDWTKDLVQLAKTAELKKHALTLQLHTAHILSAHASLEQKNKAIQDLKEQKNKLDTERNKLLTQLRQVNEDRDQTDLLLSTLSSECATLQNQITNLQETEYLTAKRDVDKLRQELGQPPLPSVQSTLDSKASQYLTERRLNTTTPTPPSINTPTMATSKPASPVVTTPAALSGGMSFPPLGLSSVPPVPIKRPRGRPKGSKNRVKSAGSGTEGSGGGVGIPGVGEGEGMIM